jgi:hypothetical protein
VWWGRARCACQKAVAAGGGFALARRCPQRTLMVVSSMLSEVRRRVDQKVADFGAPGTVTIALR